MKSNKPMQNNISRFIATNKIAIFDNIWGNILKESCLISKWANVTRLISCYKRLIKAHVKLLCKCFILLRNLIFARQKLNVIISWESWHVWLRICMYLRYIPPPVNRKSCVLVWTLYCRMELQCTIMCFVTPCCCFFVFAEKFFISEK